MKSRLKVALAGLVGASMVVGMLGFVAQVAQAANPTPAYEPDPNANGTLAFFDASGNQVLSGGANDAPFATYIRATQDGHTGTDAKATLFGYLPKSGQATGAFSGEQLSLATTYPITTAGTPSNISSSVSPTVQMAAANKTLAGLANDFPNTDPSTTNGFGGGLYQLRVKTSGGPSNNTVATTYEDASIVLNGCTFSTTGATCPAGSSTWTQVYPAVVAQATSVTMTVSPPSPQNFGTTVNLTATVTPSNAAGTVQFQDGGSNLGATVTVSGGVATMSTNTLAAGTHQLTAVFTPSNSALFGGSTSSPAVPYTINGNPTTTGLTINPGSSQAFSPVTFTATVSPSTVAGSVAFSETGTVIATVNGSGTFVYVDSSLPQGTHTITAVFTPSSGSFTGSQATAPPFTLGPPACTTCQDTQNITLNVPNGTLVISTPYTSAQPLNLGTMVLNSTATQYSVTGNFTSITVTDSRAGNLPWTVSAQSSNLVNGSNIINSQNIGLTSLVAVPIPGNALPGAPGNITTTDNPAANPAVAPAAPGTQGLGGGVAHTAIHANNGAGSISFNGTLTVNAPTSTGPGTYNGTITFTIG